MLTPLVVLSKRDFVYTVLYMRNANYYMQYNIL